MANVGHGLPDEHPNPVVVAKGPGRAPDESPGATAKEDEAAGTGANLKSSPAGGMDEVEAEIVEGAAAGEGPSRGRLKTGRLIEAAGPCKPKL